VDILLEEALKERALGSGDTEFSLDPKPESAWSHRDF